MATVKPFKALRPRPECAKNFASLPYDVYSRKEAKELVEKNPLSFMRIDRAETNFDDSKDMYAHEIYEKAKEVLDESEKSGLLIKEDKECYYIYSLTMNGRTQTGITACFSIDDYLNGIIKKHEETRKEKQADRIRHIDVTSAHTGPIFLAVKPNAYLETLIEKNMKKPMLYDFISIDNVRQQIWKIDDDEDIARISEIFKGIDSIYIADGHHRCSSAVAVGLKRRRENPGHTGKEEFNYLMGVVFPSDELCIMPYNRVVRDLNGLTEEDFLTKISEIYEVEKIGEKVREPEEKGKMAMYIGGIWYMLTEKPEIRGKNVLDDLDVSVLQDNVLEKILGIDDPTTSKRVRFIGGIRGTAELEKRCADDMLAAFAMYPTSMDELMQVADEREMMPPKSTWFEPKLQSGLFIHRF